MCLKKKLNPETDSDILKTGEKKKRKVSKTSINFEGGSLKLGCSSP